jgi:hypothetical protein
MPDVTASTNNPEGEVGRELLATAATSADDLYKYIGRTKIYALQSELLMQFREPTPAYFDELSRRMLEC